MCLFIVLWLFIDVLLSLFCLCCVRLMSTQVINDYCTSIDFSRVFYNHATLRQNNDVRKYKWVLDIQSIKQQPWRVAFIDSDNGRFTVGKDDL